MQNVACANWNFDGCLQLGYMTATNLYQHIYILHTLLVMYGCRAVPFLINHLRVQCETAHGIKIHLNSMIMSCTEIRIKW